MEKIIKEIKVEGYQDSDNIDGIILAHKDMPVPEAEKYAEMIREWGRKDPYDIARGAWLAGWDYCRELVRWKTGIKV